VTSPTLKSDMSRPLGGGVGVMLGEGVDVGVGVGVGVALNDGDAVGVADAGGPSGMAAAIAPKVAGNVIMRGRQ
jgi:hypothetical protein